MVLPQPKTLRLGTILFGILALVLVGLVLQLYYSVVTVIGLSLLLTYLLLVPVNALERVFLSIESYLLHHQLLGQRSLLRLPLFRPRFLAVLAVFVIMALTFGVSIQTVFPSLALQLTDLARAIPGYAEQAAQFMQNPAWFSQAEAWLPAEWVAFINPDWLTQLREQWGSASLSQTETIGNFLDKASQWLVTGATLAVDQLSTIVTNALTHLSLWVVSLLLIFYSLLDGKRLSFQAVHCLPIQVRHVGSQLLSALNDVMLSYVKGQVLLGLLTGFYMLIVYSIFGVKYALLLALVFAVAEFLPVVGTWLGITPGLLVILFTQGPWVVLWVWLCSYCFQTVKDNILQPKIAGDIMGLHPVVVILSLLFAAKVSGLLGVVLVLPLVSFIRLGFRILLQQDTHATANRLESNL